MATTKHVICPDCGGIIGATRVTDEGHPCTCYVSATGSGSGLESAVTSEVERAAAGVEFQKVCIVCGKDVRGHRRVKDSRGYTCYACAKEQRRQELGDTVRCPACDRRVRETSLSNYEGMRICTRCIDERRNLAKASRKRGVVDQKVFEKHEKKQVVWLVLVLLALLGLGALGGLGLGWF